MPTITLSPAVFAQDTTLTPLLYQYFSDTAGEITITGVQPANYHFDTTNGVIQFSGTGSLGPFDGMNIQQVTITSPGGAPTLFIVAQKADSWTLHDGFPEVKSPVLIQLPLHQ